MGPPGSKSPYVTNLINFIMIGFNIAAMTYTLKNSWTWLIAINLTLGCLTSIFMWCVMFSDPGIQSRNQRPEDIPPPLQVPEGEEEGAFPPMDFTDPRLSLSPFEAQAI